MPTRTVAWDIEDAIIAPVDVDDNPGTAVPVEGIVSIQAEIRVKSGEQPGDGQVYSVLSKITAASLQMSMGDLQGFEVIEVLTGQPPESSGSPQALLNPMTGRQFPFFLIAGKTFIDDGVGNFHVWVLKAKITSNFSIGLADGAFVVPQFTATAIPSRYVKRQGRNVVVLPIRYPSDVALAIPPVSVPLIRA
jgi:hypothetical protein